MKTQVRSQQGFTLIELSIVVVILGVLAAGILSIQTQKNRLENNAEITKKFNAIEDALKSFQNEFDRLPCPSNITADIDANTFGVESDDLGDCTNDDLASVANDISIGGLPVRNLGLPDEYAFDPWGGRVLYAVEFNLTGQLSDNSTGVMVNILPSGVTGTIYPVNPMLGGASVTDGIQVVHDAQAPSNSTKTTNAVALFLSYGPNGHGAHQFSGNRKFIGSSNSEEWANCDCTASANGTWDNVFVSRPETSTGQSVLSNYDDIVRYYHRGDFISRDEMNVFFQ